MTKELDWELFVWVMGMRGPVPQVWAKDYTDVFLSKAQLLQKHVLDESEQDLGMNALAAKYPYKAEQQ